MASRSLSLFKRTKAKRLQEATMEFAVHPAVMLADTVAGAMALASPGSGTHDEQVLEKVDVTDPAWRHTSKTWGDARLLTSVCLPAG
jgi:hypothetical protein